MPAILLLLILGTSDTAPQLSFNLELSLGSEQGEDHYLFSAQTFFTIQENGEIVILDSGNKRVLIFSEKGEFILSTGSEGEGPGEFSSPSEITNDAKGNLYVFDAQALKISVFNSKGVYLKTLPLPAGLVGLLEPSVLPEGNILFSSVQLNEQQQQVYCLSLYTPEMVLIKRLASVPQPVLDWSQSNTSAFWVDFLKDHLEGLGRGFPLAKPNGQGFVTVQTSVYAATLWDSKGKELGNFSRSLQPLLMSEAMKQKMCEEAYQLVLASGDVARFLPHGVFLKAMAEAELPPAINPIAHLFSRDGGFGVLANYDSVAQRGRVELFNQKGEFLQGGNFQGLASSVKWSRNKWYTMGENEDGIQVLQRYEVVGAVDIQALPSGPRGN